MSSIPGLVASSGYGEGREEVVLPCKKLETLTRRHHGARGSERARGRVGSFFSLQAWRGDRLGIVPLPRRRERGEREGASMLKRGEREGARGLRRWPGARAAAALVANKGGREWVRIELGE